MRIKTHHLSTILLLLFLSTYKGVGVAYAEKVSFVQRNKFIPTPQSLTVIKDSLANEENPILDDYAIITPLEKDSLLWKSRPLRVGLVRRSWPLYSIDPLNNLSGYNPDVMREVLHYLHYNYQIYVGSLQSIDQLLNDGSIDVIFGFIKKNDRSTSHLFSMPYLYIDYRTAVLKNNKQIKDPNNLNNYGATVALAAEDNFIQENVRNFAPNVTIKIYKDFASASQGVFSKECDALIKMDCIPFYRDNKDNQQMRLLPNVYTNFLANTIAVRNDNKRLIYLLNNTLFKLTESGRIDKIKEKYHLRRDKKFMSEAIMQRMNIIAIVAFLLFLFVVYLMTRLIIRRKENKENSKLFLSMLENIPVAVFLSENSNLSHIEYHNHFSSWLDVQNKKLIIVPAYYDSNLQDELEAMILDVWESGKPAMTIFELVHNHTEESYYCIVRIIKITDANKDRIVITSINSTDLIRTKKLAELNDSRMTNFLFDISFEIRTLLNPIVGFSQLIPDVQDSLKKEEYLTTIEKKSQALNLLINDVLVLSKLESKQYNVVIQKINIVDYLDINQSQLCAKFAKPNFNLILDHYYYYSMVSIDVDLYQILMEQLLRSSEEFMDAGDIHFGFVKSEGEFIIYSKGKGNEDCNRNLLQIIKSTIDSNYFGIKNRFSLAISFAAAKLLNARAGLYHTQENGVTIWFSIHSPEENQSEIKKPISLEKSKRELAKRWDSEWFELDDNNEYQERRRNEK